VRVVREIFEEQYFWLPPRGSLEKQMCIIMAWVCEGYSYPWIVCTAVERTNQSLGKGFFFDKEKHAPMVLELIMD